MSQDLRPLGQLRGTRIREGHENYPLMYNMLTGIRKVITRQFGKPDREVNDSDFSAAHKLAFEVTGDETTPSSKYDFKFKDYAPWVFRKIRDHLKLDSLEYMMALTDKFILSQVGSPGKSGSFFYYSYDYRYIIKTVHRAEHKLLLRILPEYYRHICDNPNTLLSRVYGLHRIRLPHQRKIYFVVMSNIFPPDRDIHEIYDLKGSTLGRKLDDERSKQPGAVMKDINWLERQCKLELGPGKRIPLMDQLAKDVELLARLKIMDYSLLVGVHHRSRGNRDLIRQGTLKVFAPDMQGLRRNPTLTSHNKAQMIRQTIEQSSPVALSSTTASRLLPASTPSRVNLVDNSLPDPDDGGLVSTDEYDCATGKIYYIGVIDIFTPFNFPKRVESLVKAAVHGGSQGVSAVHPTRYGKRFLFFMNSALKHREGVHIDFEQIGTPLPPHQQRRKWE